MAFLKNTLALINLFLLAWFTQQQFLFNSDVSWLMIAADRLLHGGHYATDFFEVNPPLILYLYAPAVLLTKLFSLSAILAIRIYIFLLAAISLFICSFFLKKEILIAIIFLLLPLNEFGQREHFVVIFTLPYFLLITSRLQGRTTSKILLFAIGILSGLGFLMKPYFLIPYFMVELYYCYRTKNFFGWIRLENIAFLSILIAYALVIFLKHQDYIHVVLPLITHIYYQTYHSSLKNIIFSNESFFTYFVILFYCINKKNTLCTVLLIGSVGFWISFFLQRNFWYYHYLPVFSLNVLTLVFLFEKWRKKNNFSRYDYLLPLFVFLYLFYRMNYLFLSISLYPFIYFLLFLFVFALFLPLKKIIFPLLITFLFYENVQHTVWQPHLFFLTTSLLLLFFILFAEKKSQPLFLACSGILFFAYPFYLMGNTWFYATSYQKLFQGYLTKMNPYTQKSVYFFSDSAEFAFPTVYYLQQQFASRFGCLGWASSLEKNKKAFNFLIDAISEDIEKNKPDFIFVDIRQKDPHKKIGYFGNNQVNYLPLFSLNASFKKEWLAYRWVKTLEGQPLYKFQVYERITPFKGPYVT